MNGQSIREAAMAAPKKTQDVPTPFWPGTDGQIVIADMNTSDLSALSDLAKTDSGSYGAALVIKALASKTGEQIFTDADRDWLKARASVVMPLTKTIQEFLGLSGKEAIKEAKND